MLPASHLPRSFHALALQRPVLLPAAPVAAAHAVAFAPGSWLPPAAAGAARPVSRATRCRRTGHLGARGIGGRDPCGRTTGRRPAARLSRLPGGADHHYPHRLGAGAGAVRRPGVPRVRALGPAGAAAPLFAPHPAWLAADHGNRAVAQHAALLRKFRVSCAAAERPPVGAFCARLCSPALAGSPHAPAARYRGLPDLRRW